MMLYIPTKIYNEKKCVENHSRELAALGKKALIVSGRRSSLINGSLEDVCNALDRENRAWTLFHEIEENPSVKTVMQARELGIQENVDFVIGLGGGSPMDAAKAIALMIANPDKDEQLLYEQPIIGGKRVCVEPLPVAAIPTTAGTGSEVTQYAILTRENSAHIKLTVEPHIEKLYMGDRSLEKTKQSISHSIFPTLTLVDSTYLQTVSQSGCINTAIDTLAHLIESHLNTNANAYSRIYSEMGLRTWAKVKDKLFKYEIGQAERELLMEACTLGGMAIAHTGTSIPHGLSYRLTCELDMPHGKAVGIFLPGLLRNYDNQEEVAKVNSLLGFSGEQSFSEYIRNILGKVTISDGLWQQTMDEVLDNPSKLKNYPFLMNRDKLNLFFPDR